MLKSKLYTGINLESFHTQNHIFTKITGGHMEDMEDLASPHYSAWQRKRQVLQRRYSWLCWCVHQLSQSCEHSCSSPAWEQTLLPSSLPGRCFALYTKTFQKKFTVLLCFFLMANFLMCSSVLSFKHNFLPTVYADCEEEQIFNFISLNQTEEQKHGNHVFKYGNLYYTNY